MSAQRLGQAGHVAAAGFLLPMTDQRIHSCNQHSCQGASAGGLRPRRRRMSSPVHRQQALERLALAPRRSCLLAPLCVPALCHSVQGLLHCLPAAQPARWAGRQRWSGCSGAPGARIGPPARSCRPTTRHGTRVGAGAAAAGPPPPAPPPVLQRDCRLLLSLPHTFFVSSSPPPCLLRADYRDSAPEPLEEVFKLYAPVVRQGRWTHGLIEMWWVGGWLAAGWVCVCSQVGVQLPAAVSSLQAWLLSPGCAAGSSSTSP